MLLDKGNGIYHIFCLYQVRGIINANNKTVILPYRGLLETLNQIDVEEEYRNFEIRYIRETVFDNIVNLNYYQIGNIELNLYGKMHASEFPVFTNGENTGIVIDNAFMAIFDNETYEAISTPFFTNFNYLIFPTLMITNEMSREKLNNQKLRIGYWDFEVGINKPVKTSNWYETIREYQNQKLMFTGVTPLNVRIDNPEENIKEVVFEWR